MFVKSLQTLNQCSLLRTDWNMHHSIWNNRKY
jgi:hypothetical protein